MKSTTLWSLPADIAQIRDEDPGLIESILATFVQQMRLSLSDLDACLDRSDVAACERCLHKLKGALLQIGAAPVANECEKLQSALRVETPEQLRVRQASIATHCSQIAIEIGLVGYAG